jgi:antitoxin VapB
MNPTSTQSKPRQTAPSSAAPPEAKPKTAKLFKNGRSQAVRLPKEFRFEGTEVEIRQNPATGEVVLSQPQAQKSRSWQEWFDLLDTLDIPEDTFVREVQMPTERDIF